MKTVIFVTLGIITLFIVFSLVFYQFDHTHWNGISEEEDDTVKKKFFNRLYFVSSTYSTVGYGDISPKSINCRIAAIVLQSLLVAEIVQLAISLNKLKN